MVAHSQVAAIVGARGAEPAGRLTRQSAVNVTNSAPIGTHHNPPTAPSAALNFTSPKPRLPGLRPRITNIGTAAKAQPIATAINDERTRPPATASPKMAADAKFRDPKHAQIEPRGVDGEDRRGAQHRGQLGLAEADPDAHRDRERSEHTRDAQPTDSVRRWRVGIAVPGGGWIESKRHVERGDECHAEPTGSSH